MAVTLTVVGKYNGRDLAKAEKQLQELKRQAQAASSPFTRLGDTFTKAGDKISSAGKSMTRNVTMPLAGMAAAAGYAYAQVDEGLDTVAARSGATGQALAGLQDSFKTVARTATQDMTTVGEVVGDLSGRLGLTGKPLETLSANILDFARITGTDAKAATDAVSKAMVGLGVGAGKSSEFLDLLLVASQKSGVAVDTLAGTLAATGPMFRTMGFDTEQATSFIAAFERAGLPTSKMLMGLNTAAAKMAKEGVKDIPGAMQGAIDKIKNAGSAADATRIAVDTFGSRTGIALADSIRNGTLSVEDLNAALGDSKGALANAKSATDGPAESIARLKNNFMLAGASIADAVVPTLERLVPVLQGIAEKFANLSPGVKTAIVVIAGVAAALGPVLVLVGNVTKVFGAMSKAVAFAGMVQKAFKGEVVASAAAQKVAAIATKIWTGIQAAFNLVMSANPIVLVGLAIAALVAGVIIAYKKFAWFRNLIDTIGRALKGAFVAAWNTVKKVVGVVVNAVVAYFGLWKKAAEFVIKAIVGYFRLWQGILSDVVRWVSDAVGKVVAFFKDIPSKLAEIPKRMVELGKNIIEGIWEGISSMGSWLWDKVKGWAGGLLDGVKGFFGISSPSKEFASIGEDLMKGLAVGIDKGGKNIAAKVGEKVMTAAKAALDKVKEQARQALDMAENIASSLRTFGGVTTIDASSAPVSAESVIGNMKARLDAVRRFGENLSGLKKLGLNNASLQEIIAAGPTAGNAIAEALLKEGSAAIGEVNTLERQLRSSAGTVGDLGARSQYGFDRAGANAVMNASVSFVKGSVVVNVGAGADRATVDMVQSAVEKAVDSAARRAVQSALVDVAKGRSRGSTTPPVPPKPLPPKPDRGSGIPSHKR